jgi:hypothetical protein
MTWQELVCVVVAFLFVLVFLGLLADNWTWTEAHGDAYRRNKPWRLEHVSRRRA